MVERIDKNLSHNSNLRQNDIGTTTFWNKFYGEEVTAENKSETYDWFAGYEKIKSIVIEPFIKKEDRILITGCGNSTLGEQLYQDGYKNIVNVDFSEAVIDLMRKRNSTNSMEWKVVDISDMNSFDDESFDVILDKGTFDSVMCGQLWYKLVPKVLREMFRVIKKQGTWIMISFADDRLQYLEEHTCSLFQITEDEATVEEESEESEEKRMNTSTPPIKNKWQVSVSDLHLDEENTDPSHYLYAIRKNCTPD